jgi:hypothetical protein
VSERGKTPHPKEAASSDPEVLRAALIRESQERRRAECRANVQTEVVKLALDLLVREPDVEGFFGALCKTMVEESDSHTCALWLLDDDSQHCELWMAYVKDRLFMPPKGGGARAKPKREAAQVSVRDHGDAPSSRTPGMDADHRVRRRRCAPAAAHS